MEKKHVIVLSPQAKEKGVALTPPDGCEVEMAEIVDGRVIVTFKEKEKKVSEES